MSASITGIIQANPNRWDLFAAKCKSFFNKTTKTVHIIATEAFATLRYVLPASLKWVWRKYVSKDITTIPLEVTVDKVKRVAYLHIHGKLHIEKDSDTNAVLLCHGDYGHPYSMLHLADQANKKKLPTFSLYILGVHKDKDFGIHNELLDQAIGKIECIVQARQGKFEGILAAGHSKGAILLAHRHFVDVDARIKTICAIGGRLRVPTPKDCTEKELSLIVNKIYEGICAHPERPLVQIVAKNDWNCSQDSMKVRPEEHCYSVPGMHLSGLYTKQTRKHFDDSLTFATFAKK